LEGLTIKAFKTMLSSLEETSAVYEFIAKKERIKNKHIARLRQNLFFIPAPLNYQEL